LNKWSKHSLKQLETCDSALQLVFNEVLLVHDCRIIEGHRGKVAQDLAFREKRTKLKFPNGRHNKKPSKAVDVIPCRGGKPIPWTDTKHFVFFAGHVFMAASFLGIPIRWGGNWDRDEVIIDDQSFDDLVHWELDE
jgi:peptidoglycan LD-endopeptidase CwlK